MAQESDPLIIPKELREPSTSHESVEEKSQVTQVSKSHHMKYRQGSALWSDLLYLQEGTIPHSVAVGLVIAVVCGVALFLYYSLLFILLEYVWHTLPELLMERYPTLEQRGLTWTWIPFVVLICAIGVGCCVIFIGEPGDLAYTIKCVHEKGFLELNHMYPMIGASLFSIVGASSLGPEAPVVAICACLSGYISHKLFKVQNRNILRKHTLMGMAAALAAFFGDPLGGSLFALEVNSRFGVEYFEHTIEAIMSGVMTLVVYRYLLHLPMGAIFNFETPVSDPVSVELVLAGFGIGIVGTIVSYCFIRGHFYVMKTFGNLGLLDNKFAIMRAICGGIVIAGVGLLVPQTLFWGEEELQVIVTLGKASQLPLAWPTSGLIGFELDSAWHTFICGVAKLIVISFSISGGFRGGFIFPAFVAGSAFGRWLCFLFPTLNPVVSCLCFAATINVALTKTSLATPLILCNLSGEGNLLAPVLTASLTSLFLTSYLPFIKTQVSRSDLPHATLTPAAANWKNLTDKVMEKIKTQRDTTLVTNNFILSGDATSKQVLTGSKRDSEIPSIAEGEVYENAIGTTTFGSHPTTTSHVDHTFKLSRVSQMGWYG